MLLVVDVLIDKTPTKEVERSDAGGGGTMVGGRGDEINHK
jgi:hypothetical protein